MSSLNRTACHSNLPVQTSPSARLLVGAAVASALLAACASQPLRNDQLDQAHNEVQTLAQDPDAGSAAGEQLRAAQNDLQRADTALANREPPAEVSHLAYLARKEAEAGLAKIEEYRAREQVSRAELERNRILLQARTQQAQQAQQQAELARAQAQDAQQQAQQSQLAAQQASADASATRSQLENAQQQLADLQAKQTERGMVLTLSDVLFDTNEATLKPGAAARIDRIASFLQANPQTHIIIEGYTDSTGTAAYNEGLSERRAHAVADQLETRGISPDRVRTHGRGQEFPVATNATAAGRQQNRRVEIVFSDTGGRFAQGAETPTLR
jgi:outer membrane protein OmpA-like peptidoglycan-associated protein